MLILFFRVRLYSEGLISGGKAFQNGLELTIKQLKTALKYEDKSLKQRKQLTLTVHEHIFGRAYYRKDICV